MDATYVQQQTGVRLTILGGGGFRVPLIYRELCSRSAGLVDEVVLYDVDEPRLGAIEQVLCQLAEALPHAPRVTSTCDLDGALDGAAFVFCAIRVGGLEGRTADERIPLGEGLLGQETTGLGGVGYGLRTVPVARHLARRIAEVAPEAWTINFTNPAGMVTEAMSWVLGDRVVGICDTPMGLCRRVARTLEVDPKGAWYDYAGLNHLGWLRGVHVDGRDRLPGLLADDVALAALPEGWLFGATWLRALGAIPNEYVYYYDFARDAVRSIRESAATRGEFLLDQQRGFYDTVAAQPWRALAEWQRVRDERDATYMAEHGAGGSGDHHDLHNDPRNDADGGYEQVAVALMDAIARGSGTTPILNVRNRAAIPGLPADAVVEVPCAVDAGGAHPVATGGLDPHQLGLAQQVKAVERTTIEAALTGSRSLALRALASHPLADSVSAAERVLDAYIARFPDLLSGV